MSLRRSDESEPYVLHDRVRYDCNGRLKVSVTIANSKIETFRLTGSVEDELYVTKAVDGIFPAVIEAGNAQVDSMSGTATTSDALIEVIQNALEKAEEAPQMDPDRANRKRAMPS